MWIGRHRHRDQLSEYWNAFNRGEAASELARLAEAIDPANLAAIDSAHALHLRHRSDPAFANKLETELMNALAATPAGTIPLPRVYPGTSNGRREPGGGPAWLPSIPEAGKRRNWAIAQLAIALLFIVTLVGGYVVYNNHNEQPAVIAPASPVAEPTGDWTQYRNGPAHSGVAEGSGPHESPITRWTFQTQGPIATEPAVVDGVVYISSGDGNLYALNSTTGEEIWSFAAELAVDSTPAVSSDTVYIIDRSETLFAVDRQTGEQRWRFNSANWSSSAVIAGDVLYVAGNDGNLYALDQATGEEQWRFDTGAATGRTPAYDDGVVYIGTEPAGLFAVGAESGTELWNFQGEDGFAATTVVAGDTVYQSIVDSADNRLYALDAASGEERWSFASASGEIVWLPLVDDTTAYVPSNDGNLYALDATTGEERWTFAMPAPSESAFTLGGDTIFIADTEANLYAIDSASGLERWRMPIEGGSLKGPSLVNGTLYLGSTRGVVYAIGALDDDTIAAPSSADATPEASQNGRAAVAVELLWQTTGGPEPLIASFDSAVGPDGNLWVIDACNNRFQIFDPDGTFIETWGEPGTGPGQFNFCDEYPNGPFAFDSQGNFYIGDAFNYRIQKFDRDLNYVASWGSHGEGEGQFLEISGLATDESGNVIACDMDRSDCQSFDADGKYQFTFDGSDENEIGLDRPSLMASDTSGNIYVPDISTGRIFKFGSDGAVLDILEVPREGLNDVAVDAAGNIYVALQDAQRIQVYDPSGQLLTEWDGSGTDDGAFLAPAGVAVDEAGNVYVSDIAASRVIKYHLTLPLEP